MKDVGSVVSLGGSSSLLQQKSALSLCDQAKQMYERAAALRAVYQAVSKQPARAGCAAVCMSVGLCELLSGNLISGTITTGAAALEISHLFRGGVSSDLQRAFDDLDADVGMVQELQEANAVSYRTIEQQLIVASEGVKGLQEELASVEALHGKGLSGFEEKRQEAASLNQQASAAYASATSLFLSAQEKMGASQKSYQSCKQAFEDIQHMLADSDERGEIQSSTELLAKAAKQASLSCDEGKNLLDESNILMQQAFEQLQKAHDLKNQANRAADRLLQEAEDSLRRIVEKSALIETCDKAVNAAQQELKKVQKRHDQIMRLIEALKKDIRTARELAESRWTTSELVAGMGTAVCLASTSPFSAIVVGGAAAYALRHRADLFSGASKIYRWAVGAIEPPKKSMEESECLRMEFSATSSGYWGYFIEKRPSSTVGTVDIHLGKGEIHSLSFDLRNDDKIAKLDVLELLQLMTERIMKGKLTPKRCLAILDQLTSPEKKLVQERSELNSIIDLLRERCVSLKAAS